MCPFLLRCSRSDNLIGIAGARGKAKLAKYLSTIGVFIHYTGGFIGNHMYHIIRLRFLVHWDSFQVHMFIFIGFAVVLGYHRPEGQSPGPTPPYRQDANKG